MSLSFKEVDPSVLGPKYKKVKVEEPGKKSNFFKADPESAKNLITDLNKELNKELTDKDITDVKDAKKLIDEKVFGKEPENNEMYQKPFVVDVPQPEEKKPHFVIGIDPRVPMPCPFCGGESKIKTGVEPIGAQSMLTAYARCYCDECKTMGPKFYDKDKNGQFVFDSLDAWNRRM